MRLNIFERMLHQFLVDKSLHTEYYKLLGATHKELYDIHSVESFISGAFPFPDISWREVDTQWRKHISQNFCKNITRNVVFSHIDKIVRNEYVSPQDSIGRHYIDVYIYGKFKSYNSYSITIDGIPLCTNINAIKIATVLNSISKQSDEPRLPNYLCNVFSKESIKTLLENVK